MGKIVNIRNIPEDIYLILKRRAAEAGMSLSAYVLLEIQKRAEIPTPEELRERLAKLPPVTTKKSSRHRR
jgi:plasmid stability protein